MANSTQVKYGAQHLGRISTDLISGQKALSGGRLVLSQQLWFDARRDGLKVRLFSVRGELWLSKPCARYVAALTAFGSVHVETDELGGDKSHLTVAAHLDNESLLGIERERASADLELELRLELGLFGPKGPHTGQAWITRPVLQSEWLKCLDEMGWEKRFLLEIPIEGGRLSGSLATAAEHMRRALNLQRQRSWTAAISEARKVLESIREALDLKAPSRNTSPKEYEEWDFRTRIENLRASAHKLCHLASHAGVSDDPGAEEAHLALSQAGVLLAYYATRTA